MKIGAIEAAAAAALLLCASSALAAPHITVTGTHASVAVTGAGFPNGVEYQWETAKVYAHGIVGMDNTQTVLPTQHHKAKPPCLVACEPGQFYSTLTLSSDPCTGAPGDTLNLAVQLWARKNPGNILFTKDFTVQCPGGAQAPTHPGGPHPRRR